jgi:hypothetical protein
VELKSVSAVMEYHGMWDDPKFILLFMLEFGSQILVWVGVFSAALNFLLA